MAETSHNAKTLQDLVNKITLQYLQDIDGCKDSSLYYKIIDSVEEGFFRSLISFTNGNQKEAAEISGISRNTIRKKLKKFNIET